MHNLITYQADALRTEAPLPTKQDRLDHAGLGFITEIGEIATCVKRIAIYGKTLDSLDKDGTSLRAHIAEEIGDTMWYAAIASSALNLDIFQCVSIENQSYKLVDVTFRLSRASSEFIAYPSSVWLVEVWDSLVNLAGLIGMSIDSIAGANISKLRARFPDAFSAEAAEARADKGGLDARNS